MCNYYIENRFYFMSTKVYKRYFYVNSNEGIWNSNPGHFEIGFRYISRNDLIQRYCLADAESAGVTWNIFKRNLLACIARTVTRRTICLRMAIFEYIRNWSVRWMTLSCYRGPQEQEERATLSVPIVSTILRSGTLYILLITKLLLLQLLLQQLLLWWFLGLTDVKIHFRIADKLFTRQKLKPFI